MTLVISQKFVFTDMLKSIERYKVSTLPCVRVLREKILC